MHNRLVVRWIIFGSLLALNIPLQGALQKCSKYLAVIALKEMYNIDRSIASGVLFNALKAHQNLNPKLAKDDYYVEIESFTNDELRRFLQKGHTSRYYLKTDTTQYNFHPI